MIKIDESYPVLPPIYALTFQGSNTTDLNSILSVQAKINVKAQELKGSISIFQIHSYVEENWNDWMNYNNNNNNNNSGLHNDKSHCTQINEYISRYFDRVDNPSIIFSEAERTPSEKMILGLSIRSKYRDIYSDFPEQNIKDDYDDDHSVPEYNLVGIISLSFFFLFLVCVSYICLTFSL